MKTLSVNDQTYSRLTSILHDVMHAKKRDVDYDEVINELIDIYQDNSWTNEGAGAGGG